MNRWCVVPARCGACSQGWRYDWWTGIKIAPYSVLSQMHGEIKRSAPPIWLLLLPAQLRRFLHPPRPSLSSPSPVTHTSLLGTRPPTIRRRVEARLKTLDLRSRLLLFIGYIFFDHHVGRK
jgi:hypothetical protein